MGDEKIEQHVTVSGHARTGDITLIGKIVNVVNIVRQPSAWQEAIWAFLSSHWRFVIVWAALQVILANIYLHFKNLYQIPLSYEVLAALILTVMAWGVYGWLQHQRTRLNAIVTVTAALSFFGMVGWQAWQIVFLQQFEPQVFGIAVAELGEGPDYRPTDNARELSGQVYERLCQEMHSRFATGAKDDPCTGLDKPSTGRRVEIRRIGIIPDSQTAQWYGARVRADVVVWGQMLGSEQGRTTIRFQVLETLDQAVNPEFPVVLPITTKFTEVIVKELDRSDPTKLKEVVAQQSTIISSFALGLIAYLDRDFLQAVKDFSRAAKAIEPNPTLEIPREGQSLLFFYLGRSNNAIGRFEEGQTWLKRAQDANPQEPAVPLSLALGYGSLGQEENRDAELGTSLKLVNTWLQTRPDDNVATYDRGLIYQIRGQYDYAVFDFQAVLNRDPRYYVAYIGLGQAASKLGNYKQAEDALRNAITLTQKSGTNPAWAYLNLALIYEEVGEPLSAKTEFQQAIAAAPKVDSMYAYYARFLESQQEMDAALLTYRKLIEVSWDKGWAYGSLAGFLKRRGLLSEASENYARAVHEKPEDSLMRTYLAETYLALGAVENARKEFETAIGQSGSGYYSYATYAGFLFQLGDFARAAEMYRESLKQRPTDCEVLLNLGHTYENLGETAKAKQAYNQVVALARLCPEERGRAAQERLKTLGSSSP